MDFIQYSKNPILVAKIQELFGIRINYNKLSNLSSEKLSNERLHQDEKEKENNINTTRNIQKYSNGILKTKANTIEEESFINSELNDSNFTITNKFWYYLFLFGTELGDEIFYSSFIPFWFWNIDGAVGRRVVLVWAIVMTIGNP